MLKLLIRVILCLLLTSAVLNVSAQPDQINYDSATGIVKLGCTEGCSYLDTAAYAFFWKFGSCSYRFTMRKATTKYLFKSWESKTVTVQATKLSIYDEDDEAIDSMMTRISQELLDASRPPHKPSIGNQLKNKLSTGMVFKGEITQKKPLIGMLLDNMIAGTWDTTLQDSLLYIRSVIQDIPNIASDLFAMDDDFEMTKDFGTGLVTPFSPMDPIDTVPFTSLSLKLSRAPRPGFDVTYVMSYSYNLFSTIPLGLQFELDSAMGTQSSITTCCELQNKQVNTIDGRRSISYAPKLSGRQRCKALFSYTTPQNLRIGDTIRAIARIQDLSTVASTSFESLVREVGIESVVVDSHDPNNKVVVGDSCVDSDEEILYRITFSNDGLDTAFMVVLFDILDSALDVSTYRFIGSSHTVNKVDTTGQELTWIIDGVSLPPNETPGMSQGYIEFAVKPVNGLNENHRISNRASIIFDDNETFKTDEAIVTVNCSSPVSVCTGFVKWLVIILLIILILILVIRKLINGNSS